MNGQAHVKSRGAARGRAHGTADGKVRVNVRRRTGGRRVRRPSLDLRTPSGRVLPY